MAFPVSLPDDGLIDITITSNVCPVPSLGVLPSAAVNVDTLPL